MVVFRTDSPAVRTSSCASGVFVSAALNPGTSDADASDSDTFAPCAFASGVFDAPAFEPAVPAGAFGPQAVRPKIKKAAIKKLVHFFILRIILPP